MPHMVRVYIRSAFVGLLLACCFVAALLALDVAHLRHLVFASGIGWLAVAMMVAFHTILFGGVQFAITIMAQAESPPSSGGRRRMVGASLARQTVMAASRTAKR